MYLTDATFHTAVLMTPLTLCWTGLIDKTHVRGYTGYDSVVLVSHSLPDRGLIVAWKYVLVCRPQSYLSDSNLAFEWQVESPVSIHNLSPIPLKEGLYLK